MVEELSCSGCSSVLYAGIFEVDDTGAMHFCNEECKERFWVRVNSNGAK